VYVRIVLKGCVLISWGKEEEEKEERAVGGLHNISLLIMH
jgi:hypothetical protein